MGKKFKFDSAYYRRYYRYPNGRARDVEETWLLGGFVFGYLDYLKLPVKRVLDIGCGLGYWREVVESRPSKTEYVGVENSKVLCDRFGWTHGSVVDFKSRRSFDLVICDGVLQYLAQDQAVSAVKNLASLCSGALYLNALTREDWRDNCDQSRTDGDVYVRKGDWYRRQLEPYFVGIGGCLFLPRSTTVAVWELGKSSK